MTSNTDDFVDQIQDTGQNFKKSSKGREAAGGKEGKDTMGKPMRIASIESQDIGEGVQLKAACHNWIVSKFHLQKKRASGCGRGF